MSSNRGRRIDRLLPGLSAQERAIFELRQFKAGAEKTPAIFSTMPRHQVADFNRYMRLVNCVNSDLGAALLLIDAQVRQTETKHAWLSSLLRYSDEVEDALDQTVYDIKDAKRRRGVKAFLGQASMAWRLDLDVEVHAREPVSASVARALVEGVRDGTQSHWRELRTIELVIDEVAEEFDGEDPLRAETRRLLDDAKAACVKLGDDLRPYAGGFTLAEPTEEDVELVRSLVKAEADRG